MYGDCASCKQSSKPGIAWKYASPEVVNDIVTYRKHRYCLNCAVQHGLLSVDEAKQQAAAAKCIGALKTWWNP